MTQDAIDRQLATTKAAIMAGRAEDAVAGLDRLVTLLRRNPPGPERRASLEAKLTELRGLAEAALTGARSAAEQIQALVQAARSLETYDRRGQRKIADTATAQPRRY